MLGCRRRDGVTGAHGTVAHVQDQQTEVTLSDTELRGNDTIGAFVNKGASAALLRCRLSGNGSSGCEVRDRLSTLAATECAMADNGRVGLYAHSAAAAVLRSCTVEGNQAFGLLCGGRAGADIGGGSISVELGTSVDGGDMVRHGGRIFSEQAAGK